MEVQNIMIDYRIGILWLQCILSWGTGLLLFDTAKQITENRFIAWSAWGIYLILVGMSPWVSIPYSDSAGLIFPIAILWLYVKLEKQGSRKKWWYGAVVGLLAGIGYRIKPQIVIVMIAIFIVHGMCALKDLKYSLKALGSMLIGLLAALFLVSSCIRTLDIEIDSEKTYGMAHFLMMGMNYSEGVGGNGV